MTDTTNTAKGEKTVLDAAEIMSVEEISSENRAVLGERRTMLIVLLAMTIVSLGFMAFPGVPREVRGYFSVLGMISLMGLGMPVAIAMAAAGGWGLYFMVGGNAVISAFKDLPFRGAANWTFSVLPMFVLMGIILWRSGVTEKAFTAARNWLNWLPGSLAVATNFAGAGLAATSGSTMGISFALTRIAVPEMLRRGYDAGLAAAVVTMAGTLGQLIPPSILLVIYAGIAQVPVGPLMMAAMIPGLLTAAAYGAMIVIRVVVNPALAPKAYDPVTWPERWKSLLHVWPIPAMIFIIMGGMFSGVFTATEAGAYAALTACLIAFSYQRMKAFGQLWTAVVDTASAMGSILILIMGVTLLQRYMALSGMPQQLASLVDGWGLNREQFLIVVMILYYILGTILEPLAIMLLTIPVLTPTLASLDVSMIWFGVFSVIMGELAVVSPPVGTLVFLVHRLINQPMVRGDRPPISLWTVFMGCNWFQVTQILIVILMIFFPEPLTEWLPSLSRGQ